MKINGKAIETARTTKKLSRERLARAVDVSTGTILRIERGDGSTAAETLAAIAVALDMPIEEMFIPTGEAA